jgi:aryl-alcohol dehydrogenase-like predicted oxidoreductase
MHNKYVLADSAVACVISATRNPEHMEDNFGAGFGRLPDREQCRFKHESS